MRKRVILALMLAFVVSISTGCGLIVRDTEVDRATPIIEAAGKVYTKGEIKDQVDYALDYQAYMYSMYGYSFDKTDLAVISQAQEDIISALIQEAVTEQKAVELGQDQLTEEELTAVQTAADETFQGYVDSVKSSYFADTELTDEALDVEVAEMMAQLEYPSLADLVESEKATKIQEKLKTEVVKDVTVSEEEIQARYDEKVAAAKESYLSDLTAYGTAVRNGETIYYTPAGYRYVKHILRQISEEDSAAISELETKVSAAQALVTEAETSLAGLGEDPALDSEEDGANRAQWEQDKAAAQADADAAQAEVDTAREAAYAKLQPIIAEIRQKLGEEGADFDALMEEYGEDDGMKASPAKEQGYLVCEGDTQWVTQFTEGAMALAKVGDVSPDVRTDYGIHILRYESDLAEGETPLDTIRETIHAELLTEKQDAHYDQVVSEWVSQADAQVDRKALNN